MLLDHIYISPVILKPCIVFVLHILFCSFLGIPGWFAASLSHSSRYGKNTVSSQYIAWETHSMNCMFVFLELCTYAYTYSETFILWAFAWSNTHFSLHLSHQWAFDIKIVKKVVHHPNEYPCLLCAIIVHVFQSTCYALTHHLNVYDNRY